MPPCRSMLGLSSIDRLCVPIIAFPSCRTTLGGAAFSCKPVSIRNRSSMNAPSIEQPLPIAVQIFGQLSNVPVSSWIHRERNRQGLCQHTPLHVKAAGGSVNDHACNRPGCPASTGGADTHPDTLCNSAASGGDCRYAFTKGPGASLSTRCQILPCKKVSSVSSEMDANRQCSLPSFFWNCRMSPSR